MYIPDNIRSKFTEDTSQLQEAIKETRVRIRKDDAEKFLDQQGNKMNFMSRETLLQLLRESDNPIEFAHDIERYSSAPPQVYINFFEEYQRFINKRAKK